MIGVWRKHWTTDHLLKLELQMVYQLKIVEYVYGKSSKIIPLSLCISHLKTFPLSDLNGFKTSGFSMFFYII